MSRRVNLPGAEELFRPTQSPPVAQPGAPAEKPRPKSSSPEASTDATSGATADSPPGRTATGSAGAGAATSGRKPSGRVKHDEKITVYVSREELLAVETARLALRAEHHLAVDRGRIVRAALAAAVSDLEQHGAESDLVRRLSQ